MKLFADAMADAIKSIGLSGEATNARDVLVRTDDATYAVKARALRIGWDLNRGQCFVDWRNNPPAASGEGEVER